MSDFCNQVLEITKKIPTGYVATYAQIAKLTGNQRAYQAVGQALKRNPTPVKIPCHRAVRTNGDLGGYVQGRNKKIELLRKEGIRIESNKIDLRKYGWQGF